MNQNKQPERIDNKPLSELSMGQRRQFAIDRIDQKGGAHKRHGLTELEQRKGKALQAINEHGSGHTRSHGRRALRPQTREDLKVPSRLLLGSGAVLLALAAVAGGEDKHVEGATKDAVPATTVVTAEPGDTIWNLQKAEGTAGRDIGEVVFDAVQLNGDSSIHPGDQVILINDPSTPSNK